MEDRGLGFLTAGNVTDFTPQRAVPLCKSPHDMPVLAQRGGGGSASTHSQLRQYKSVSG
jgi:hypothetical protein